MAPFSIDPQTTVASPALKASPRPVRQGAPPYDSDALNVQLRVAESSTERLLPDAEGPRWLSSHFEHGDDTHLFKLYVPGSYTGQPLPMILMLHGAQQDPDDFAAGTEMNAAAEAEGYIVVYPLQSESANPLRCWNWFRPADRMRGSGETAMLAALTSEVMAACNVDRARVYIAGMSAGGAMAVNLAVTHPDLYAAAAIHSGVAFGIADEPLSALCAMKDGMVKARLPEALTDGARPRAVPLIVFHGEADDTVHPRNSDQIVAMSELLLGAPHAQPPASTHTGNAENGHAYTRRVFRDREGVPTGEQWLVHGLGHAWSGGHPAGSHTDVRGPHATQAIVQFFGQFALESS
nr:PHB depolymerase family esterase [Pararobbsia alpina]